MYTNDDSYLGTEGVHHSGGIVGEIQRMDRDAGRGMDGLSEAAYSSQERITVLARTVSISCGLPRGHAPVPAFFGSSVFTQQPASASARAGMSYRALARHGTSPAWLFLLSLLLACS